MTIQNTDGTKKNTASWFLVVITTGLITFDLQRIDKVMDGGAKFMLIKLKVLACLWRNSILRQFHEWLRFPMAQKNLIWVSIWLLHLSIKISDTVSFNTYKVIKY